MSTARANLSNRPAGETWIWFTSMGLAAGLLMVIGLLGTILVNGLGVFWPKPVLKMTMTDGKVIAGRIVEERMRAVPRNAETPATQPDLREWLIATGNKDTYGAGFRFVAVTNIAAIEHPSDAIFVERMEYGPLIGEPERIVMEDGASIAADDTGFDRALDALIREAGLRRDKIRRIERDEVGRINRELEALRIAAKTGGETGETESRKADLEEAYRKLAAEASSLRADQNRKKLVCVLYGGEEITMPAGQLVSVHRPNRMQTAARIGFFFKSIWRFVSEEPREANTEGGIFPAIFGTFAMTLLMSIAVMPLGILAAIYLREYARQGAFVRIVRISVNNLAGVPSIVFGVFGLGFFVYVLGGSIDHLLFNARLPTPTFGTGGILWAALTLALMTVPVVIVSTEEALAAVPRGAREGSLALGASKWQTISRVVLPASAPGIMTGLVLAMARGAGEVAPLMLVGVVKLAPSLPFDGVYPYVHLDQKFMHLGFHIYDLGFQSPDSDAAKPMVFATTLFLILLVVLLNLGAIVVRERLRKRLSVGAF